MISAGEWVTASGEWVNDRSHGQQFKARFLRTSEPSSIEGIEKYLGSGMIRGIGPVHAKRMVRHFGKDAFDIIEASPLTWYFLCSGPFQSACSWLREPLRIDL
jgi:exodeoxyribonuclease V alpha subunit